MRSPDPALAARVHGLHPSPTWDLPRMSGHTDLIYRGFPDIFCRDEAADTAQKPDLPRGPCRLRCSYILGRGEARVGHALLFERHQLLGLLSDMLGADL